MPKPPTRSAPRSRRSTRPRPRPTTAAPSHVVVGSRGHESRMVDVGEKPVTARRATARARVRFPRNLLKGLLERGGPKGPITEVARAAGVLAAKRTGDLIPMCHPLGLDVVDVRIEPLDGTTLEVRCTAACTGRTGVEMEAMVGAAIAALTIYDMTKALDPRIEIRSVELLEKSGGKSGHWKRTGGARARAATGPGRRNEVKR